MLKAKERKGKRQLKHIKQENRYSNTVTSMKNGRTPFHRLQPRIEVETGIRSIK